MHATTPSRHLLACPDCDLLQRAAPPRPGQRLRCRRCGAVLYRQVPHAVERGLALVVTGVILFALANAFPLLSLQAQGQVSEGTLLSATAALFAADRPLLAGLVLLTTFVFPLLDLAGHLYLLLPLRHGRRPPGLAPLLAFLRSARPWGMLEVFLLSILVAVVKLGELATVIPGPALYAFVALIATLAALSATLDPDTVWHPLSDLP